MSINTSIVRNSSKDKDYSIINRTQGHHLAISPKIALEQFKDLATLIKHNIVGIMPEETLCISLAESATALGFVVADEIGCEHISTTKHMSSKCKYIDCGDQWLNKELLDAAVDNVEKIIIIDDVMLTGNTALSVINAILEHYGNKTFSFSVATLVNGISDKDFETFEFLKISLHYCERIDLNTYTDFLGKIQFNDKKDTTIKYDDKVSQDLNIGNFIPKTIVKDKCKDIAKEYINNDYFLNKNILVLGTGEFTYPAIYVASLMEDSGLSVKCQAITRSLFEDNEYISYLIKKRLDVPSLYYDETSAYIYNIGKYDTIIIVTDCNDMKRNIQLVNKLTEKVCKDIFVSVIE